MTEPLELRDANGTRLRIEKRERYSDVRVSIELSGKGVETCFYATPEQWARVTGEKELHDAILNIRSLTAREDEARRHAGHVEEAGEVCVTDCLACNDPIRALIRDLTEARNLAFERAREIERLYGAQVTQGEWLPIESAPKDGTEVLLVWHWDSGIHKGVGVVTARWACRTHSHLSRAKDCPNEPDCNMNWDAYAGEMSHWRPKPLPPSTALEGQ